MLGHVTASLHVVGFCLGKYYGIGERLWSSLELKLAVASRVWLIMLLWCKIKQRFC